MKKNCSEVYALSFGLGFVSLLLVLLPLMIADKGYFIYYGDFVSQQLPFYYHANEVIRSGGLFGWDWGTDLGSSFIGSYAFYLTGSPFFWLTRLLPQNAVLYAIPWLLCLKHGTASVTAYAYIKRFVRKQESALIGGLLYAFSGFQVFNIFFNHFQDVTAFFPLMLISMEELIVHNRKGFFALITALMGCINYFFFAGQVVFLVLYFLMRCPCKDFPVSWKKFFALAIEAILGTGLACVVLIPAGLAVLKNYRVSEYLYGQDMILYNDKTRIARIIQGCFMIPDPPARVNLFTSDYAKWSSIGAYLPLFSMAGVIAFLQNQKKHWASRIFWFCAVCAVIPILNSMFYAFNASYYARWYYMPILIMAMMTAYALDNTEICWRSGMKFCMVMLCGFGVISLLPVKEDETVKFFSFTLIPGYFYTTLGVSVLCWFGAYCILKTRKKKEPFLKTAVILTVTACVFCTGTVVCFGKVIGTNSKNYIETGIHGRENLDISYETDKAEYFRTDISKDYDNYPMFWGLSSMRCFQSVVSPSVMEFYDKIGIKRDVASRPEPEHYTIRGLCSVKYYFDKLTDSKKTETQPFSMPGFAYLKTENGFDVYENQYFIPMGFTYDNYVLTEDFEKKPDMAKERMLIHALVLTPEQAQQYQGIIQPVENPEKYTISEKEYLSECERHQQKCCYDFQYDAKHFSAKINLPEEKLVFFSVPYDDGWTASINGNLVQVEKVSNGFMAVKCEKGENQIVFSYHLPGLKAGVTVSLAGLVLFLVYLLTAKKLLAGKTVSAQYAYLAGVRASDAYIQYLINHENQERSNLHESRTSERNETQRRGDL